MKHLSSVTAPKDLVTKEYCDANTHSVSDLKPSLRENITVLPLTSVANLVQPYGLAKFRVEVPTTLDTVGLANVESIAMFQMNMVFDIKFKAEFDGGSVQEYNTQGNQTFSTHVLGSGRATYFSGQSISPAGELSMSGYVRAGSKNFIEALPTMMVYLKPRGKLSDMAIPSQQEVRFVLTADMIKGTETRFEVPNRTNPALPRAIIVKVNRFSLGVNSRSEMKLEKGSQ